MTEVRKLAAILVADIVGFSRLASSDEDRILARLRTLRSDLIDPTIAVHHGRTVTRTGDGSIVEFRSVVDAVRCAIEVQNGLAERNAGLPPERRIDFRVGIHLGDVVEEDDGDLMGDGVNIASRLEGVARPGAICLSEQAYWQVKGRLDLKVTDLGATRLKNVAEPIRVYSLDVVGMSAQPKPAVPSRSSNTLATKARRALKGWPAVAAALVVVILAAGTYAWHADLAPRLFGETVAADSLKTAPRLSVVVLPFENLSGDPEQEYFADGITDDLTTDLSHLPDSFVISGNTASTYKGKPVDAKQIGRELGVRYVLEGSVRRVGDKVALNAQLISTKTGAHLWADRFDGERGKLGELQAEFVSRLANSLAVALVSAEALRAARERPSNPDAVDLAMQGWAAYNRGWTAANVNHAIHYFERALQLDPEDLRAQVGLALGLVDRLVSFRSGNEATDLPRVDALLTSVLAKEPNNAWAHWAKANSVGFARKQFNEAISELNFVIENDRNFAQAYALRGLMRLFVGRAADVIPEEETALRLSPRDPLRNLWEFRVCHAYAHLAEWGKAAEWCRKSIATNPGLWLPYIDLIAANAWLGNQAEAKAGIAGLHKLMPGFTVQDWASIQWSEDPQFQREYARLVEGLRKAGLPEG